MDLLCAVLCWRLPPLATNAVPIHSAPWGKRSAISADQMDTQGISRPPSPRHESDSEDSLVSSQAVLAPAGCISSTCPFACRIGKRTSQEPRLRWYDARFRLLAGVSRTAWTSSAYDHGGNQERFPGCEGSPQDGDPGIQDLSAGEDGLGIAKQSAASAINAVDEKVMASWNQRRKTNLDKLNRSLHRSAPSAFIHLRILITIRLPPTPPQWHLHHHHSTSALSSKCLIDTTASQSTSLSRQAFAATSGVFGNLALAFSPNRHCLIWDRYKNEVNPQSIISERATLGLLSYPIETFASQHGVPKSARRLVFNLSVLQIARHPMHFEDMEENPFTIVATQCYYGTSGERWWDDGAVVANHLPSVDVSCFEGLKKVGVERC